MNESTDILRIVHKRDSYIKCMINRETVKPKKQYYSTLIHMFFSKNHHKSCQLMFKGTSVTRKTAIYQFDVIICFFLSLINIHPVLFFLFLNIILRTRIIDLFDFLFFSLSLIFDILLFINLLLFYLKDCFHHCQFSFNSIFNLLLE